MNLHMNLVADFRNFLDVILKKMIRSEFTSRWLILSIDVLLSTLSAVFSYTVCVLIYPSIAGRLPDPVYFISIYFILILLFFLVFKTHVGIVRYSSYYEVWRIFMAIFSCTMILAVGVFVFKYISPVALTGLLINFTGSLLILVAFRYAIVKIYGRLTRQDSFKIQRAFIFESSRESVALASSLMMSTNSNIKLVGFVTTDEGRMQKRIMDLPVLYANGSLERLIVGYNINSIIFPDTKYLGKEYEDFIKKCISLKLKVLVHQSPQDVTIDGFKTTQIRNVQIEDLLGRDEIEINNEEISSETYNKVVLVTGAAGSIGSEIVRQIAIFKPSLVILFDSAETPLHNMQLELEDKFKDLNFKVELGDVRRVRRVTDLFLTYRPQIVYHAAAYKHVPLMEDNPCEAIFANVFGTRNMVNHALRYGAEKFVMISTDKAVNPTNVMGASKRIAEIYVQSLAKYIEKRNIKTRFITTRFGNVLGSNGSVIPRFRQQIEQGGPITVTHPDITRYFMTIPEACRLVLEAGTMGKNGEIYVFDMGEPVRIDDMARRMIQLAGFVPNRDIQIVYTGLRPGEKLYEELLNNSEHTKPTRHEKIMVADVREYDFRAVVKDFDQLVKSARKMNEIETVQLMKNLVPEFLSQNSIYAELDKKLDYKDYCCLDE